MFLTRLKYLAFKSNFIRFFFYRFKYKVSVGDYVKFDVKGTIIFENRNITIRDFSEIIVNKMGFLKIKSYGFIGRNVEIGADYIEIGTNSTIQNNCTLLGNIIIGSNCIFGPSIYISSGQHFFRYKPELLIRDQDMLARNELDLTDNKIIIEDDVWIGKNVVIINNVIVGKGSIIGANTIINKNVEPYTIVAGTPQKTIGKRLEFYKDMPYELIGNQNSSFPYFFSGFDYSLEIILEKHFVTLVNKKFSIYIKNINHKNILTIEFLSIDTGVVIKYENESVVVLNNIARFNIDSPKDDKYIFEVNDFKNNISIKKVYFENK